MKRCHNNIRPGQPKYDGDYRKNLSFPFILLDPFHIRVIRDMETIDRHKLFENIALLLNFCKIYGIIG